MGNKHTQIRPRSLNRIWRCPGSLKQSEGIKMPDSQDANIGTKLHQLSHLIITGQDTSEQAINLIEELGEGGYETASNAVSSAKNIAYHAFEGASDYEIISEQKLISKSVKVDDENYLQGTPDLLLIKDKKAVLIDYKMGRKIAPPPKSNLQLASYALMVFECYEQIEEVSAHIIQPNIPSNVDDSWVYRKPELIAKFINEKVIDIAKNSSGGIEELNFSEENCCYCPAQMTCPKVKLEGEWALRVLDGEEKDINLMGKNLENTDLTRLLVIGSLIAKGVVKAKEELVERLNTGQEIESVTLCNGKRQTDIISINETFKAIVIPKLNPPTNEKEIAEQEAVKANKMESSLFWDAVKLSYTKLEKNWLLANGHKYKTAIEAKKSFAEIMNNNNLLDVKFGSPYVRLKSQTDEKPKQIQKKT